MLNVQKFTLIIEMGIQVSALQCLLYGVAGFVSVCGFSLI
jgi:hypothetical protein